MDFSVKKDTGKKYISEKKTLSRIQQVKMYFYRKWEILRIRC